MCEHCAKMKLERHVLIEWVDRLEKERKNFIAKIAELEWEIEDILNPRFTERDVEKCINLL